MTRRHPLVLTLLAVAGLVAAACSDPPTSGGEAVRTDDDGDGEVDLPECPLDALDEAGGPVEVDLWYGGATGPARGTKEDTAAAR